MHGYDYYDCVLGIYSTPILTSSMSASICWYFTSNPFKPECSRFCHDTTTEYGWISWIASLAINGNSQKSCGSICVNMRPRKSTGSSHFKYDWLLSATAISFWWSFSHSHSSCESHEQYSGLSAEKRQKKMQIKKYIHLNEWQAKRNQTTPPKLRSELTRQCMWERKKYDEYVKDPSENWCQRMCSRRLLCTFG